MAIEQQEEPKSGGAPAWMCTFADLMSLLLTFFVLLLSMSSTESAKFRAMAGSLRDAFGMKSDFALSPTSMSDEILPHDDERQGDAGSQKDAELEAELREALEELGVELGDMKLDGDEDSIVLRLEGDLLFDSGEATLKPEALPALDAIAKYLRGTRYQLDVVGHTDNVPIATAAYPSNWELSAARAARAVRHIAERQVEPKRLRAIGHAEIEPIADNSTAEGRAKNRRVEFIFTQPPTPGTMTLPGVETETEGVDSTGE